MSIDVEALTKGVLARDRSAIGRAITLVESNLPSHAADANALLSAIAPHAGNAHRVGITGVPGAGKSTFIEALGMKLLGAGHRVAVLAVDPTSSRSGGSILADKTRMNRLSREADAFVRPSPSAGTLGGVTKKARETMMILEAAGHDVVLVETVGVGQSETAVAEMVDFFLLLTIAGAGDELQAIKKGVVELADLIAVNKADGDGKARAKSAASALRHALGILTPASPTWRPPVTVVSSLEGTGIDETWAHVEDHRAKLGASGELDARRRTQRLTWFRTMVETRAVEAMWTKPTVAARRDDIEQQVLDGTISPSHAVAMLLDPADD